MTPISAIEKPMTTTSALMPGNWLINSPAAATSAAMTAWRLCRPVLSAFQPTTIIAGMAQMCGMEATRLSCQMLRPGRCCTIFGNQMFRP